MKEEILEIAHAFIQIHFPNCKTALLSGSVVRGEETSSSDLDIVVMDHNSFRKSYLFRGRPIEVFAHNEHSLEDAFFIETQHGVPLITRMCAEGKAIIEGPAAEKLIARAKNSLEAGPSKLLPHKLDEYRYTISDQIDDLEGSINPIEDLFTVSALIESLHQFILRSNQNWAGEGKWMYRSLKKYDESLADRFTQSLQTFYSQHDKAELIRFADEVLAPYGGRLFYDYYSKF